MIHKMKKGHLIAFAKHIVSTKLAGIKLDSGDDNMYYIEQLLVELLQQTSTS
jgi:hypothetical protein